MPKNSRKDWIEIKAAGPWESRDEAASLLIKAGSPGILEEDKEAPLGALVPHSVWLESAGEPRVHPREITYIAYLKAASDQRRLEDELEKIGWACSSSVFKDRDWTTKWRSGIRPVRITGARASILIKPTWKEVKRRPGEIIIEIDPGLAFGTGGHATTKTCLKAMLFVLKDKKAGSFLDVGTGTGVLAIAARKLRVKKAVGIDIDPAALKVARKNARLNRTDIALSGKPVGEVKGAFDIVVANILAGELKKLKYDLYKKIKPGGFLILSGILREEAQDVKSVYLGLGLKDMKTYLPAEWAALVLRK
ncbi:MAG: 50S ribosomal protein L11 methyltransferase [Deltaproteobacteria bacterium]|nr:50S ribosomal protein L11 methyltransferase [Deltaproteobacteria bacterium]